MSSPIIFRPLAFSIHQFSTHEYWYEQTWDRKEPNVSGTYTFDGKYLVLDGGFKKEVVFSEDGNQMEYDGMYYERLK